MDEKNRLGLLFTGIGAVAGIVSALLTGKFPLALIVVLSALMYYGGSYVPHLIGVDFDGYGGRRKILQTGVFSFIQGWIVLWFLLYELVNFQ